MKKLLAMLTICALLAICALADEAVEVWDEPAVDEVEEFELGEENTPWEDDGEEIDPPLEEEEFDLPLEEESALADEAAMVEIPAGGVDIDTAFPDDNFRAYVSENFDTDHDGKLSEEECKAVTSVDLFSYMDNDVTVETLAGIEYFPELDYLYCNGLGLKELDVSANKKLTFINCSYNQISVLDVSNNSLLEELNCTSNKLTAINVSNNSALVTLDCGSNLLSSLDVTQNTNLATLNCHENNLDHLNLSANAALEGLDCEYNRLNGLDLSHCPLLSDLSCNNNQITSLDLSHNTAIKSIRIDSNRLTSLILGNAHELEWLECDNNQLTALDVSSCPALQMINCSDNQIGALDISHNLALDEFYCSNNRLNSLNTSKNSALLKLQITGNGVRSLDLSGNPTLWFLACGRNELSVLDLTHTPEISVLICHGNPMERLDISACPDLLSALENMQYTSSKFTYTKGGKTGTGIVFEDNCTYETDEEFFEGWNYPQFAIDASTLLLNNGKAIYAPPAASVALSKTELSLTAGGSATLTATIAPANALNSTVVWSSSDASVATVKDGVVTALKPGSATITAAASDNASVKAACAVKVVPPLPASVTLSKTELSLTTGGSATLTATVAPANASSSAVVWTSSDASVATVKDGVVTAVKPGSATITAAATDNPSAKAACAVKVVPPVKPVPKTGSNGTLSVNLGDQVQLSGDFATSRGWKITRYQSGKSSVATVTQDGLVTAKKEGKVKITITTANKKKATVTINVVDPTKPTGVKITQGKACTLKFGETLRLEATLAPATAQSALTWKSSKPKVASVSPNGVVTPKKEGTTKITVTTRNKKKATVTVKVVDPYKPTGVKITQGNAVTLNLGQSLSLGTTLSPAGARSALTWKSSKPKVASVSPDGVVTPKKEGTAKITVTTYNKKKATVTVKVVDPTKPTGVKITQGKAVTLKVGQTLPLEATLSPVTAQSALTWKSSKSKVASVSPDGVVTANKKGTAKITVTARNKKKATLTIKVVD